MSKFSRTSKFAVVATAVALSAVTLMPGTAEAAAYGGQCGAGYTAGSVRQITGGSVYLARNGATACAVTIRDTPGTAKSMSVWVRTYESDGWVSDPGNYTSYAGPVYTSTYLGCADYGGRIESSQITYTACW